MENFPHVLWINLDKDNDRNEYMKKNLDKYKLKNTRISGYDGNNYEDFCITNKKNINKGEYGCFCSHIKALEYFINSDIGDFCLIVEDDVSFDYTKYWKKTFWDYINDINNYEIVQLAQTFSYKKIKQYEKNNDNVIQIIKHEKNYYGCGCYLITKDAAIKLINMITKINNKYDLTNIKNLIIDSFIYENLNSYTIPLFTTVTHFKSNIHQDHIQKIHIPSKNIIMNMWLKENNIPCTQ